MGVIDSRQEHPQLGRMQFTFPSNMCGRAAFSSRRACLRTGYMWPVLLAGILAASAALAHSPEIEVHTLVKSTRSWDGAELPAYPAGVPEVTILRITIPPNTALPMHKHPVINTGVLLTGELVVTDIDGAQIHLRAGEPIVELVNRWHYGRNPGDQPAEILVFYAGVEGMPVTIPQPGDGAPRKALETESR